MLPAAQPDLLSGLRHLSHGAVRGDQLLRCLLYTSHGEDLVAIVGQTGGVIVAVGLLCNVPAECHLQGAVAEQGDLVAACDGSCLLYTSRCV